MNFATIIIGSSWNVVSLTFFKECPGFGLTEKACRYVGVLYAQVTREGRKLKTVKKKY